MFSDVSYQNRAQKQHFVLNNSFSLMVNTQVYGLKLEEEKNCSFLFEKLTFSSK
jgi:hypothetical protein